MKQPHCDISTPFIGPFLHAIRIYKGFFDVSLRCFCRNPFIMSYDKRQYLELLSNISRRILLQKTVLQLYWICLRIQTKKTFREDISSLFCPLVLILHQNSHNKTSAKRILRFYSYLKMTFLSYCLLSSDANIS